MMPIIITAKYSVELVCKQYLDIMRKSWLYIQVKNSLLKVEWDSQSVVWNKKHLTSGISYWIDLLDV